MSNKNIIWVFIAALAVRLALFPFANSVPGDADCRALISLYWTQRPYWIHDVVWLPLHFYLVGTLFKLIGDILLSGKIVSLIFGSFSVIPFAVFARHYLNRRATIIACVIFIFFGLHIRLSIMSLAETITHCLFFCSIALLIPTSKGKSPSLGRVSLSGLCLLLANLNRQDVWAVAPVLIIAVWIRYGFKKALLFGFINSLVIGYFAISYFVYHESYFHALNVYQQFADANHCSWQSLTLKWVWYIAAGVSPVIALMGGIGVITQLRRKKMALPLVILFTLLLSGVYMTYVKGSTLQPRYLLVACSIITIFAACMFDHYLASLRKAGRIALCGLAIIPAVGIYGYTTANKPDILGLIPKQPVNAIKISDYLRKSTAPTDRFIVDDSTSWAYGILLRYSPDGKNTNNGRIVSVNNESKDAASSIWQDTTKGNPKILVVAADGAIEAHILKARAGEFTLVREFLPYRIYRRNSVADNS